MRHLPTLTLLLLAAAQPADAAVRPVQAEIVVTDIGDTKQASLNLDVLEGRRTVYRLICGPGGAAMMMCRLTDKGGRNLLDSRAHFLPDHILGACADDPMWGRARHFKAGDMMVALAFSDIIQTRPEPVPDGY